MRKCVNVIGIGRHAKKNIYPCLRHLDVEIESITTNNSDKARKEMENLGIQAKVFSSVDEMLNEAICENVIVVVPMQEASDIVLKCLKAGKRVFVEKPCGLSYVKAKEVFECSSELNLPVFVGFMKRYAPIYQKMKTIIKQEELGSIRSFEAHFNVDASAFCETDRDFIYAVGIHYIDLIRYLCGDVKDVRVFKNEYGNGVSYALAFLMENGTVGTLNLENRAPWSRESEGLTCTLDGGFIQSKELNELIVHKNNFVEDGWNTLSEKDTVYRENYSPASGNLKDLYLRGFMKEIEDFFGTEKISDDNLKTVLVCDEILNQLDE